MVRTFAVAQFLLSVKSLAAKTIQTAVFAEIDIARFVHPREDFLNETNVIGVSGPDKVVIGDPAVIPDAAKGSAYTIGELFRGDIRLCCDLRDLVTMFVSAREVKQRRCNVYWFHQRPLTAPNKNFSSTMRRFKLRWMRAAAPAVCERAESLWLTLLSADCCAMDPSISRFTNPSDFCVTLYINRSRYQVSAHLRNLSASSRLPESASAAIIAPW